MNMLFLRNLCHLRNLRIPSARRRGAVNSLELVLILPLVFGIILGIVEFGILMSGNTRLETAADAACRVVSLPSDDPAAQERAAMAACDRVLGRPALIQSRRVRIKPGRFTGDPVSVEVRVPMTAAAPDMLGLIGFSLEGRELVARSVMRRE